MFGRKKKPAQVGNAPGLYRPDPERPEAKAALDFVELASNKDLHAATQLLTGGRYGNEVWTEVLMINVLIAHLVAGVRENFREWIDNAPSERRAGLEKVLLAAQELDVAHLDYLSGETAVSAQFGLAMSIGYSEEGMKRLLMWVMTGQPNLPATPGGALADEQT
jgi:hypothetical protein